MIHQLLFSHQIFYKISNTQQNQKDICVVFYVQLQILIQKTQLLVELLIILLNFGLIHNTQLGHVHKLFENILVMYLGYLQIKMVQNQFLVVEINKFCEWKDLMDNYVMFNKRFLSLVLVYHLLQKITLYFNHAMEHIYNSTQSIYLLDYIQNQRNYKFKVLNKAVTIIFPKFIYLQDNYLFLKMDILQIQYSLTLILKIGIVNMQKKEQNLINLKISETLLVL
ncbi:unnamed protein product [Paramecium sonneborni]|uniref:Uncharacterized protein n=1 Tax=Paramecium sonneborni TaxID=65129 RepID=A0A8S1RUY0_9CILI|nr:unnamed protein product [Paramecium sonneborni]